MISLFNANHDRQDHVAGVGQRGRFASYRDDEHLDNTQRGNQSPASLSRGGSTVTATEQSMQAVASVGNLARQLTLTSPQPHYGGAGAEDDLFHPKKDSELDPYSSNFSAKAWAQKIVDIASKDANKALRKTGIAYRNLPQCKWFRQRNRFQPTVANVFISGIGMLKDAIGRRERSRF
jgi:hypothetical protein